MSNFLKYGDLILFYKGAQAQGSYTQADPSDKLIEPYGGVLSSLGFIENGIYMQQLPKPVREDSMKLTSDVNMIDLRTCVFTLTPKLNFDFHKDFKKTMEYYKRLELSLRTCKPEEKKELVALRDDLKAKLVKLEERTKKEEQLNFSIVRENIGKVIQYGSEVQVMHYDSNSFVRATNDCSQTETIGYMCELSNFYSGGMVFRVSPRYRSRQDGDAIQLRDNVIFQNVRHKGYLALSKELPTHADLQNAPNKNPFLVHTALYDSRVSRYRMFLSQDKETAFQVVLFRNFYADSGLYLLGGDIVRVTHTEIQADLTASICHSADRETHPELYFRTYEGEFKEENTSLNSYWVVEQPTFEEAGEKFKVMYSSSASSKHAASVRLRNLLTGAVLIKRKLVASGDFEVLLSADPAEAEAYVTLDLEPVVKNCDHLINSQIYFITESHTKLFLKQDKEKKIARANRMLMEVFERRQPPTAPAEFFYPLEDEDLCETKFVARLNRDFSSEDAFIVQKVQEAEKKDILFVRSALPLLKYLRKAFGSREAAEKVDAEVYKRVVFALQQVIAFLFDKDMSHEVDWFEIEEMPSVKKQKLLKDAGFIDAIIEVLYLPFATGLHSLATIAIADPFARMLEMVYTTLRYGIKEYRPNELYASQWLPLLIQQSLETTVDRDIRAGQTLTELIDNNQKILESRIELSTINRFITILRDKDKDCKYVEILRAICICDGKPMIKNQKDVTKRLLDNRADKEKLVFGIIKDSYQNGIILKLRAEGYEEVPLKDLRELSRQKDDGKMYRYVVSMVQLLSDLCKERNYLAIDILQKDFTEEVCLEVISKKEYGFQERQAFTDLMVNLWIDVSPLQRICLPLYVKLWDKPSESESLRLFPSEFTSKHKTMIAYIFEHLADLVSIAKDHEHPDHEDRCAFDFSVLQLAE